MKRISVAAAALAALAIAGCQQTTNNTTGKAEGVEINGAKIGETIENGVKTGINYAREAGNVIGNELGPAGDAIENGAKAAFNQAKETIRDIRNSGNEGGGNKAAPAN
jgi:hypothetical protein